MLELDEISKKIKSPMMSLWRKKIN